MSRLPYELILEIADQMDTDREIWALAKTNRALYGLLRSSVYRRNLDGSALFWCAEHGFERGMQAIVLSKADLDRPPPQPIKLWHRKGYPRILTYPTALVVAAAYGHESVVRLLLEQGATVDPKPGQAETSALHEAVNHALSQDDGHGHGLGVVQALLEHGANPRPTLFYGSSPLFQAIRCGHCGLVKVLSDYGALKQTNSWQSPLSAFLSTNAPAKEPLLRVLLNYDEFDINAVDQSNSTMLLDAIHHPSAWPDDQPSLVRLLLEHGADPNHQDINGCTPLHLSHRPDTVRVLLEYGATADIPNRDGECPLYTQVVHNGERPTRSEVLKLLIEHGANVNSDSKMPDGMTPLACAASMGRSAVVNLLLEHGADTHSKTNQEETPLHLVIKRQPRRTFIREKKRSYPCLLSMELTSKPKQSMG